ARASLTACLTQHPNFVWAYLFRSFAGEKLHATAEAEADWQKALELNSYADARYALFLNRGVFRFEHGNLNAAAADFHAAATLKPDQYNAYFNLAHVFLARGQYQAAADQVTVGQRFRPPALAVFGYHAELACSLLSNENYVDAVRECDTARRLVPGHPLP